MLKGKQKKLDANKDGEISREDFKILKSKKGMKEGGSSKLSEAEVLNKKFLTIKEKDPLSPIRENIFDIENYEKNYGKVDYESAKGNSRSRADRIKDITSKASEMRGIDKKSKGGSIFSRKNYKQTGKI
jgi:hypothetical protein